MDLAPGRAEGPGSRRTHTYTPAGASPGGGMHACMHATRARAPQGERGRARRKKRGLGIGARLGWLMDRPHQTEHRPGPVPGYSQPRHSPRLG